MLVKIIPKVKKGNNVCKNIGEIWQLKGVAIKVQALKNQPGFFLELDNAEEVKKDKFKWHGLWIELNDPVFGIEVLEKL